jgi:hypothetical protein
MRDISARENSSRKCRTQHFAVLVRKLVQSGVESLGFLEGEFSGVRNFCFLRVNLFEPLAGAFPPDLIDGDAVHQCVEPGPDRFRVFELSDAAYGVDPSLLQYLESRVLIANQL